jgi:hypothetical protein
VRTAGTTVTTISSGHLRLHRRRHRRQFRTSLSHLEAQKCMGLDDSRPRREWRHPGRRGPRQIHLVKDDLVHPRTHRLHHLPMRLGERGPEMLLPPGPTTQHRRNNNDGAAILTRSPGTTIPSKPIQVAIEILNTGGRHRPAIGIHDDSQTSSAGADHVHLAITTIERSRASQVAADGDPSCIIFLLSPTTSSDHPIFFHSYFTDSSQSRHWRLVR